MVESNTRQRNLLMLLYAMDTAGEATAAYLAEQTGFSSESKEADRPAAQGHHGSGPPTRCV